MNSIVPGIAFDPREDKIYWCTDYKIFKGNRDGTDVEIVLDTSECGFIQEVNIMGEKSFNSFHLLLVLHLRREISGNGL